jgi:ABA4-like protein
MSPDVVFSTVNTTALLTWIVMILTPARARVSNLMVSTVTVAFAITYTAIVAATWWGSSGGFSSLAAVGSLFANRWMLLAGWIHYLGFDLLVGRWELRDARTRGIPHLAVVPSLFATFMFGPAGWLSYIALRAVYGSKPDQTELDARTAKSTIR